MPVVKLKMEASIVNIDFEFKWTSAFLESNVVNEKVRLDCTVI